MAMDDARLKRDLEHMTAGSKVNEVMTARAAAIGSLARVGR
jgi:hypothetical protein